MNVFTESPCVPYGNKDCEVVGRSIRGGLVEQQTHLTKQLAKVNAAIEAMDKNPELTNLLELVQAAR